MNAEIITIGDELLIGQIVDTNSQYIAQQLNTIGVSVYQITSIQDNKYHIEKALQEAENNVDLIILTGGLGPTKDDITKTTLAHYFNDKLVTNKTVLAHIKTLFIKYNYELTPLNEQQAMLPSKCEVLPNQFGTAAGMLFKHKGNTIISLPGVPYEMKALLKNHVLPKLTATFNLPFIIHKTVNTYGMGESAVAEKIEDWENNLPTFISLAYLPSAGSLKLRLTAKGTDKSILENTMASEIKKIAAVIGDIIVGYEDQETIEVVVGELLRQQNKTLATVESCTGGAISKRITSVAGASQYYQGTLVSYANAVKISQLNISKNSIEKYTAVSPEVSVLMAKNAQQLFNVDYAIAVTGNAGPSVANPIYDVGVVFISIATPKTIITEQFSFGKPRKKVIERTVNKSLEMLRKEILKNS